MLYNSTKCEICGLYRCNPGCENEHRQDETHDEQSDRTLRRGRDHANESTNGVVFQRCGGGRRIIRKKIGGS